MAKTFQSVFMGAAGGGVGLPSDPSFSYVSFLSHFDGANNGVNNVFDDSSSSNHTITANGNVTQGSFGPFARPDGEWAVAFDGSGDYLTLPANSLDVSNNNFTLESWVYPTVTGQQCVVGAVKNGDGSGSYMMNINYNSAQVRFFCRYNGGTVLSYNVGSGDFPTNAWTHLAVTRDGANLRVFINGTQVGTTNTTLGSFAIDNASLNGNIYYIGRTTDGASQFNGNMSNLRVVIGTAVYTSDFTPSSSPLTAITNTNLLTCQSNRFVDNSTSAHTITPSGNPEVSAFGPFLTSSVYSAGVNGASGYFDGSGDYLDVDNSSELVLGTDDFTIEAWAYPTTYDTGNANIIMQRVNGGSNNGWLLGISSGGLWQFSTGAAVIKRSTASAGMKEWTHLAAVRNGSSYNFFVNGVSVGTSTTMYNFTDTTTFQLGWQGSFAEFTGYVCDARVIKGTALYTSNFTPPTAPLTAVTNTKLLLNMADGQAIDSAAQNNLTLVGTAKTSTAQSKFGGASLLLDGNSDYANFPETAANDIDGSGDWTVEFFWRFNVRTSPAIQMLVSKGYGLQLYTINGALALALSANNSGTYFISVSGGGSLSNDTWHHVAIVKYGTSYKVYLDGINQTSLDSSSSSTVGSGGGSWHLGSLETAELTYPANAYMDEVRISKTARYTSNFTPPTEPFADKGQ